MRLAAIPVDKWVSIFWNEDQKRKINTQSTNEVLITSDKTKNVENNFPTKTIFQHIPRTCNDQLCLGRLNLKQVFKWNRIFITMFVLQMDFYKWIRDSTFAINVTALSSIWFTSSLENVKTKTKIYYVLMFHLKHWHLFCGTTQSIRRSWLLNRLQMYFSEKKHQSKQSLIWWYKLKTGQLSGKSTIRSFDYPSLWNIQNLEIFFLHFSRS
jgi:hypothetical protein